MTDKTMTLEPCPFCGGRAKTKTPYVRCVDCGAQMNPPDNELPTAISEWNTRHLSQPAERGEAQEKAEPVADDGRFYVEARQCEDCDHLGINDSSDTVSACGDCEWQGPTPDEDKCPGCAHQNCMAVACPICGGRYRFLADRWFEHDTVPPAERVRVPDGWRVMRCTGSFPGDSDCWEIYDPSGSGGVITPSDVPEATVRGLLDALSAAPKTNRHDTPTPPAE